MDLDRLLVHAPKADNHYLPLGDFFNITSMPMGMPALGNALAADGWRVETIHLGVQWLVDPSTTVLDLYDGAKIRAIGLSLYWHYQSYDVIEAARALKDAHPEAFVFLGGLTGGYFADQILAAFPFVDAVVLGHAEGTLRQLVATLNAGESPTTVPNLVLQADGGIVSTKGQLLAANMAVALDELRFGDLSTVRDAEVYAKSFGFFLAYGREYSPEENRHMLAMGWAFFPLMTGRGCPWSCTFCRGNQKTLRQINGTSKVTWRDPARVVDDIRDAMSWGYKTMSLCFDPTPWKDAYYRELFRQIPEERLGCDFYFECWGLPTPDFVREFGQTFPSPESYIAISPDVGDEAVRKKNRQPYFSDAEMFEAPDAIAAVELSVDVFFTLALPGERLPEARKTAAMKQRIAAAYPNARRIMTWTVQLEPGSAQFERPQDFGMETDRSNFMDFYNAHGGDRADTYSSLGFKVNGYFGDARDEGDIPVFETHLQHLKCLEFCFLAKDPRQWHDPDAGRNHCFERRQRLAAKRGHAAPKVAIGPGANYFDALAHERQLRPVRDRYSWLVP